MKFEYGLVLALILVFPLLLSFRMPLRMRRHPRALAAAAGTVCLLYWIWDVVAAARGHWSFNPSYVLGVWFFGLPVEEWLFFPVLVFVAVFTYEAVRFVLRRGGKA